MLEVSDNYLLHLCLQAGKHQSSMKVHFNSALVSSWSKIGKILNKNKEGGEVQIGILSPKTFLGKNTLGSSASLLYSYSLCSHLIQSLLIAGQRPGQPSVCPSILLMCLFCVLQKVG